jgi:hypothetical protein
LLNAGVIPRLENDGFQVFRPGRVGGSLPANVKREDIQNIFTFSSLLSSLGEKANPSALTRVTLADYLSQIEHPRDEVGQPLPFVLLFDQFEEIFTTHLDRWENRQDFFEQVARVLASDHLLRIVFALREEYLGEVEHYARFVPDRLSARFRLEPLRATDALRAVSAPIATTGRRFAEGVAEKIISNLSEIRVEGGAGETEVVHGEFIDAVGLQVVMKTLWETLPIDATVITENYLAQFGNLDIALSKYYDQVVSSVGIRMPSVSEKMLRKWFEDFLITPMGTRAQIIRGKNDTAGMPNDVLDQIGNWHLTRAQHVRGVLLYELSHDRLIRPIQESNRRFFSSNP